MKKSAVLIFFLLLLIIPGASFAKVTNKVNINSDTGNGSGNINTDINIKNDLSKFVDRGDSSICSDPVKYYINKYFYRLSPFFVLYFLNDVNPF